MVNITPLKKHNALKSQLVYLIIILLKRKKIAFNFNKYAKLTNIFLKMIKLVNLALQIANYVTIV